MDDKPNPAKGKIGAPLGNKHAAGNNGGWGGKRVAIYNESMPDRIRLLSSMGATDEQIAEVLGVHLQTLIHWENTKPEVADAMVLGRTRASEKIERTLYKRCLGFEKRVTKQRLVKGEVVEYEEVIYVPPSDSAIMFWLKNRRPDDWQDKKELEIGRAGEFDRMSNEELENYIKGVPTLLEDKDV